MGYRAVATASVTSGEDGWRDPTTLSRAMRRVSSHEPSKATARAARDLNRRPPVAPPSLAAPREAGPPTGRASVVADGYTLAGTLASTSALRSAIELRQFRSTQPLLTMSLKTPGTLPGISKSDSAMKLVASPSGSKRK